MEGLLPLSDLNLSEFPWDEFPWDEWCPAGGVVEEEFPLLTGVGIPDKIEELHKPIDAVHRETAVPSRKRKYSFEEQASQKGYNHPHFPTSWSPSVKERVSQLYFEKDSGEKLGENRKKIQDVMRREIGRAHV